MEVEVVGGEVQHHRGVGGESRAVVQLLCRHLHGEQGRRVRVQHGVHDRLADVAGDPGVEAGCDADGRDHLRGGGLAVGPRDREPGRPPVGMLQPAGEVDVGEERAPPTRRRPAPADGAAGSRARSPRAGSRPGPPTCVPVRRPGCRPAPRRCRRVRPPHPSVRSRRPRAPWRPGRAGRSPPSNR